MSDISFETNIENHFAVSVMDRQYQSVTEINHELISLIEEIESKDRNTDRNAVLSNQITTSGGFQTALSMNLFELKAQCNTKLKNQMILPAVRNYLEYVFKDEADKINPHLVGWANILEKGNWQRPHMHPTHKNLISGCYYVKTPEFKDGAEGHIEFINPMPISVNHGFSNSRRVKPVEGKLVLFPPFYNHFVHPIKSDVKRIVIAFDVLPQAPGFKLVF